MKASELTAMLKKLIEEHGDLPVDMMQDEADGNGEFHTVSVCMGDYDRAIGFTLVGPNTADAFRDCPDPLQTGNGQMGSAGVATGDCSDAVR